MTVTIMRLGGWLILFVVLWLVVASVAAGITLQVKEASLPQVKKD